MIVNVLLIVCAVLALALLAAIAVAVWCFRIAIALYRTIENDMEANTSA